MCKNMVPLSFLKAAQLLNILQSKMLVYALNFLFCFVKYFAYILQSKMFSKIWFLSVLLYKI